MKAPLLVVIAILLHTAGAMATPPRITFTRSVAPARNLASAESMAVIYATGSSAKIEMFVEHFVDLVARAGALHVTNAAENNHHFVLEESSLRAIRHQHPADVYLGVTRFNCSSSEKQAEGSERDDSGERVKRVHHWIDAVCSARIEVLNGDGRKLFSYDIRGEGTSPRSTMLTDDQRDIAYEQAARYAAVSAADAITPRIVRESIELDESAPSFEEGFSMIRSERFGDARAIWQAASVRHPDSAPLSFDLAAVSEAVGDLAAARNYYEKASRLAPQERRYQAELRLFRRRTATARR